MRGLAAALVLLLSVAVAGGADVEPKDFIASALSALESGKLDVFAPAIREDIARRQESYRRQLRRAGKVETVEVIEEVELENGYLIQGRTIHAAGVFYWTVGYSATTQLIETLELNSAKKSADLYKIVVRRGKKAKRKSEGGGGGKSGGGSRRVQVPTTVGMTIPPIPTNQDDACRKYPSLCQAKDARTVEFLFVTNRQPSGGDRVSFTGGRATQLTFGAARVRIPEDHRIGNIELPANVGFWGYTLYESKQDEKKHFAIKSVVKLEQSDWGDFFSSVGEREALIFVHGYNTSFQDALYRQAQIIWDLQYKRGTPVLFTWASQGQTLNYIYDQQSALLARNDFIKVLKILKEEYRVSKIHVLAHSMGNLIVLDALANEQRVTDSLKVAELIMAAPDVDRDHFRAIAPEVRKITSGMTLYASSADKALTISRELARVPRAGDVPADGPVVLPGIETIDVTPMGSEFLGLNHDVFAANRSVMNDIKAILSLGTRPPSARGEIRGVPEGAEPPAYWSYPR